MFFKRNYLLPKIANNHIVSLMLLYFMKQKKPNFHINKFIIIRMNYHILSAAKIILVFKEIITFVYIYVFNNYFLVFVKLSKLYSVVHNCYNKLQ